MEHRKQDPLIKLLHWLWVGCILTSVMTGLQIWASYTGLSSLQFILRLMAIEGEVFTLHLISGYLISISLCSYLVIKLADQQRRNFIRPKRSKGYIYLPLITLVFILLTGWYLHLEPNLSLNTLMRYLHRFFAITIVLATIYHLAKIFQRAAFSRIKNMLTLHAHFQRNSITIFTLCTLSFLGVGLIQLFSFQELIVAPTSEAPIIDGKLNDPVWNAVPSISLRAHNGNTSLSIPIDIKSTHDGERIYLLISWEDQSYSINHLPLVRLPNEWQIQQSGYQENNEKKFYEDKFAVMLSNASPFDAIKSIHLGSDVVTSGKPAHGRGLHYFTEDKLVDIWHWKAVRSDVLFQADDNHFARLYAYSDYQKRYKGGYAVDPKLSGGISMNWQYNPEQKLTPQRLPKESRFVRPIQTTYGLESNTRNTDFSMRVADSYPYSNQLVSIPVNHQIPSIIRGDSYYGDRGHVAAKAVWIDGRWYLEMARNLDTSSDFDVPIIDGTYLWLAPFDHAQTLHAYHLRPIVLRIKRS